MALESLRVTLSKIKQNFCIASIVVMEVPEAGWCNDEGFASKVAMPSSLIG